jgi:hypothetical protein
MYVCELCGRKYQRKTWLDRHRELKHGTEADGKAARDVGDTQEAEAGDVASLLTRACAALKIEAGDIMSSRVYGDRVVIVEGPVGYKRIWSIE